MNEDCTPNGVAPDVQPPESGADPQFSRPAIIGAAWIGLYFLNWVVCYTPPGWALTGLLRHSPLNLLSELLVLVPLMVVGFAAIVGGSVMGGVALYQIRRERRAVPGFGLALFDLLFFPLVLLNAWVAWLSVQVSAQIGGVGISGVVVAMLLTVGLGLNGLLIRAAARSATRFVQTPPPPVRPRETGTWKQVFKAAAWRLGLVIVVQLALFETIQQASVHWRESTSELWHIALAVVSLGGLIWASWPGYRLKCSWWFWAGGTIASAFLLLGINNFYSWHLRPNLGLYQESDWVAEHPAFQKKLQEEIEQNLWRRPGQVP